MSGKVSFKLELSNSLMSMNEQKIAFKISCAAINWMLHLPENFKSLNRHQVYSTETRSNVSAALYGHLRVPFKVSCYVDEKKSFTAKERQYH